MKKVVVDSSVIVKWLNQQNENHLQQAEKLFLDAINYKKIEFIAPELVKYEIGNVLTVAKKLESKQVRQALSFFYSFPIEFFSDNQILSIQTHKIVFHTHTTYYDASFMALAKQEKAVLITDNLKHQKPIKGVKVIALKDYK